MPTRSLTRRSVLLAPAAIVAGATVSGCAGTGDADVTAPIRTVAQDLASVVGTARLVGDRFVDRTLPRWTAAAVLADAERTCRTAVQHTHRLRPVDAAGVALCRRALALGADVRTALAEVVVAVRGDDPAAVSRQRPTWDRHHQTLTDLVDELAPRR